MHAKFAKLAQHDLCGFLLHPRVATSRRMGLVAGGMKAATLLISGCQDNQTSRDGRYNGLFTEKVGAAHEHAGRGHAGLRTSLQRLSAVASDTAPGDGYASCLISSAVRFEGSARTEWLVAGFMLRLSGTCEICC